MLLQDVSGASDAAPADPAAQAPASQTIEGMQSAWAAVADRDITQADLILLWNNVGWPLTKAVILIVVVLILARWAKGLTVKATSKARVEVTLAKFFGNLVRWAILVLGAVTILQTFGVEATSFAAVLAALGFAIGLALSGTLGNVAAGVMLLVFRPYKVGDVVSVGGTTGKVDEIELFTTTLDTPDNRRIIIPNSQIFGNTIENITFHPKRRVDITVGTSYSADLDEVRSVLTRVATDVEGRLSNEDAIVYLSELGDSSISWAIRVWALTGDYWAVRERLTRNVKVALDEAGIGIPFPQRDVHVPAAITVRMEPNAG